MIVWSDQKGFSTYQVSLRRPVWTFEARLGCTACDDSILHQIHVPLIWNEWASGARFDYRSLLTSFLINISKYLFSIQRLTILCENCLVLWKIYFCISDTNYQETRDYSKNIKILYINDTALFNKETFPPSHICPQHKRTTNRQRNLFKSVKSVNIMMMDAGPTKQPAAGVFYPIIQIKYFYY